MVVTSRMLSSELGIDAEIADYFANKRKVPDNNLFWKNKRIYLSAGFGFLTIPFAFDIMFKAGISKQLLLDDDHITLMENGFDRLKRYESEELSLEEFINECKLLLKEKIKQQKLATDLFNVVLGNSGLNFNFETKNKALARSDSFLFTLVDLELTDKWVADFLPYWYSIARPILLLDDFKDLETDRLKNEQENTIIELGNNAEAIKAAYEIGISDADRLAMLNPKLSKFIHSLLKESLKNNYIQKQINS
jgi:hypothetical protein